MRDRIRSAIAEELKISSAGIPFTASNVIKTGGILALELASQNPRSGLDETMEDGRLGWIGTSSGSAEIISVLPDISVVNVYMTSGHAPLPGQTVFINPARYLEPLASQWQQEGFVQKVERWYSNLGRNSFSAEFIAPNSPFERLRPRQREAFQLPGWDVSFLWGPPGTGKTTTVGSLLAAYLHHRRADRILLISTTNTAVDLAVLSADNAVSEVFGSSARPALRRFGSRFDPQRYRNRDHLIPVRDKRILQHYENLLQKAPEPAEAEKYLAWKNQLDAIRQEIREQNRQYLRSARLAAMTATLATFQFGDLAELPPYDLVVFDEASQVGKAHAMSLATLGKRVLFAGDPQQLSPIVQSRSENAATWLGQSAFAWQDRECLRQASCFLDEQWRMAPAISAAVSSLFYESRLRVAEPALKDQTWLSERTPLPTKLLNADNLTLIDVGVRARPAAKFVGYCCPESAELISALVVDLRTACPDQEILILTPFRAQRHEIRKQLRSINAPASWASTVHRAQGSERRIVIFDPVSPSAEFVSGEEGQRLMNVAISRAECRLIVLLQTDWVNNPALLKLFGMTKAIKLDGDTVEGLLIRKLPKEIQTNTPILTASLPPAPVEKTIQKQFEDKLLSGLRLVPHRLESRKSFCLTLSSSAEFHRKLTYAQIEECFSRVAEFLPPLEEQRLKASSGRKR